MSTVWDNVERFEELVADYAGSKYAIATDSCTNALFLSFKFCREKLDYDNSHVIIPTKTYISVPMQAIHAGYKVKFVDIDWSGSYHIGNIPVVDSAQRFTKNMYIKDTFYCLSFNYKKILTTGRGGMILTDDEYAKDWFKKMRYDGRPCIFYNDLKTEPVTEIGYHMYMTPEQAVIGLQNFYSVNDINEDRQTSADYKINLSKLECFRCD